MTSASTWWISALGWQPRTESEFAEVLVQREEDSTLRDRAREDRRVVASWSFLAHPENVVVTNSKCTNRRPGHVLVRQESHQSVVKG